MDIAREEYQSLLELQDFSQYDNNEVIDIVTALLEFSFELKDDKGTKKAIEMESLLAFQNFTNEQKMTLNYLWGNAWADLYSNVQTSNKERFIWHSDELEKAIIHYRSALNMFNDHPEDLHSHMACQLLTNFSNQLSHIGRIVEAIDYWNQAEKIDTDFRMAIGNRGVGLINYARELYDVGPQAVFSLQAIRDLTKTLEKPEELPNGAEQYFQEHLDFIKSFVNAKIKIDMNKGSLGRSKAESQYRKWCLQNCLFLNPLNDLGAFTISAKDTFHLPGITIKIGEDAYFYGMFNQMKQEYVSARYLFYESLLADTAHFSDKGVSLINTLDYPAYGLAVEKAKIALRMGYSLLDKIALFVNRYFELGLLESKVNFQNVWFAQKSGGGVARNANNEPQIHQRLNDSGNWPLRGLVWLSKDLKEGQGLRESLEPDAKLMDQIRHHAEHQYLKVHNNFVAIRKSQSLPDKPTLAVTKHQLEKSCIKILKTVRAALIYLSLSVHSEERRREEVRGNSKPIGRIPQDIYEDDWKL
jgi:tetratricopeptide (TPR) repeat protein